MLAVASLGGACGDPDGDGADDADDVGVAAAITRPYNRPPVLGDDAFETPQDEPLVLPRDVLVANDHDPDGDYMLLGRVAAPIGGTVELLRKVVTFRPDAGFVGVGGFDYLVADGRAVVWAHVTVTVTATAIEPTPFQAVDDVVVTLEDEPFSIVPAVLANDLGDNLAFDQAWDAYGGTITWDGDYRFWPDPDFVGAAGFRYNVFDGVTFSTAQVVVEIQPVNDAPTALTDQLTWPEDAWAPMPTAWLTDNDLDVDGDALTVTAVEWSTGGAAAYLDAGVLWFWAAPDFVGEVSFVYVVSDGQESTQGYAVVDVVAVDDAPRPGPDRAWTEEDVAVEIAASTLLGNDLDPEGGGLSVIGVEDVDDGASGHPELRGDLVVFTPAADFFGVARFRYLVSDGVEVAAGDVEVEVFPVDDAPIAVPDRLIGEEDVALVTYDEVLLGNDREVDGEGLLQVLAVGEASHGEVSRADGTIVFTPPADFTGVAQFTYLVGDGQRSIRGVVTIDVVAVDDSPEVEDVHLTTPEGVAVSFTLPAHDVDGDVLRYEVVNWPWLGDLRGDGPTFSYQPPPGHVDNESIGLIVDDGRSATFFAVYIAITDVIACGDGVVEGDEACDPGDADDDDDGCDADCTVSRCGNGRVSGDHAESLTFTWLANTCGQPGGAELTFHVDRGDSGWGEWVWIPSDCACEPGIDSLTIEDPAKLALLSGDVTFRVDTGLQRTQLAWLVATIDDGFSTRDIVIFDAGGGGDAEARRPDLCAAGTSRRVPAIDVALVEACDDGNAFDGDGCTAACERCGGADEPPCELPCGAATGADRATLDPRNGHCFAAFDELRGDRDDAFDLCEDLGGSLPELADAAEADLVRALVPDGAAAWLGLYVDWYGELGWASGDPVDYTGWPTGGPGAIDDAHGVALDARGTWTAVDRDRELGPLVCELAPPP